VAPSHAAGLLVTESGVVNPRVRPPIPDNEAERLRALERYHVLDTPPEEAFDRLTTLAARIFEAPMALVSLVDEKRQWWKSCVGVEGEGTDRDIAFCAYAILSNEPLLVEDARLDPRFAANPLVTGAPGVCFYAGVPLATRDGFNLGTFCIIDTRPRQLSPVQLATLVDLARIVVDELELRSSERRLASSEERLAERVRVLEGVLDSAGEGVVVVNEKSQFMVFNPAARRIIGPGPDLGNRTGEKRAYTLIDPTSGAPFQEHDLPLSRALRGEPSDNLEMLVRRNDGVETLLRVTGRPLQDASGKPCGGIVTFNDITALRAAEDELARRAVTDALTGLPNRRAFDERLALLVAEGTRGRAFALVLGDVDHFKKVNDTYGHSVGDEVLTHVGQVLRQSVRCTDFVGRYGGEEFCVLFSDVDEQVAVRLADNLRLSLTQQTCRVPVTCSFGICTNRPGERTDGAALIRGADRALYAAKNQGRNRVIASQLSRGESIPMMQAIKVRA
jgi:diguanylate cyclase (GGDEF)-like protein/PAS domain S-box-containing protein